MLYPTIQSLLLILQSIPLTYFLHVAPSHKTKSIVVSSEDTQTNRSNSSSSSSRVPPPSADFVTERSSDQMEEIAGLEDKSSSREDTDSL